MRKTTRALFGTASLLAVVAATVFTAAASAQPPSPESGDPRATAYAGNIDIDQPGDACDEVGLPGDEATLPPGTFTEDGTYIDILANPPGGTITGVVVKGGPAYNVYPDLGELPWLDLHAPLNESGDPAEISHWFVCVEETATTTTTTTTTTQKPTTTTTQKPTTVKPTTIKPTTTSIHVTTTTAASQPVVTTTTTKAPAPVAGDTSGDSLATTGFGGVWVLLLAALALLALGAAVLVSTKLRRR